MEQEALSISKISKRLLPTLHSAHSVSFCAVKTYYYYFYCTLSLAREEEEEKDEWSNAQTRWIGVGSKCPSSTFTSFERVGECLGASAPFPFSLRLSLPSFKSVLLVLR